MARDCGGMIGMGHAYFAVWRWRWGKLWPRRQFYWSCWDCDRTHTWDEGRYPEDGA